MSYMSLSCQISFIEWKTALIAFLPLFLLYVFSIGLTIISNTDNFLLIITVTIGGLMFLVTVPPIVAFGKKTYRFTTQAIREKVFRSNPFSFVHTLEKNIPWQDVVCWHMDSATAPSGRVVEKITLFTLAGKIQISQKGCRLESGGNVIVFQDFVKELKIYFEINGIVNKTPVSYSRKNTMIGYALASAAIFLIVLVAFVIIVGIKMDKVPITVIVPSTFGILIFLNLARGYLRKK